MKTITRSELKSALAKATGCKVQHTGWPCGTCFFAMGKGRERPLTNKHWQAVLLTRGDSKREQLDNLPKNINRALETVMRKAGAR